MTVVAFVLLSLPVALAAYAYAAYPLLLRLFARRNPVPSPGRDGVLPTVTIALPAYNEEAQIRGAIESLLAQDYPADRRQILVVSDASSDATDAIAGEYAAAGVELLRMPVRVGKTAAENASLAHIRGDIVVNCDSSVRLHPAAVRRLVEAMGEADVGVASTSDVSVSADEGSHNVAEAGYVGYEMRIRELESACGGIVGASGSGYAIRAPLHRHPVPADLSRDFSAALTARRHGYRAVAVPDALCFVPRTASLSTEFRRKVRTIARGMATLYHNRDLLNPIRHGAFAWKLWSHKVARWLVPITVPLAAVGLTWLSTEHAWSRWALGAGAVMTLTAFAVVQSTDDSSRLPLRTGSIIGALAANAAVVAAFLRFISGRKHATWEPTRRSRTPGPIGPVRS